MYTVLKQNQEYNKVFKNNLQSQDLNISKKNDKKK